LKGSLDAAANTAVPAPRIKAALRIPTTIFFIILQLLSFITFILKQKFAEIREIWC